MSIAALEHGGRPTRRYVKEIRKLFSEVQLISGEKPRSLSQDGDHLVVGWRDGVEQRVPLAAVYGGAERIRTRRREYRRYMHEATMEAKRQALLRLGG